MTNPEEGTAGNPIPLDWEDDAPKPFDEFACFNPEPGDEMNERYKVELQTIPSPGLEFYRGFVTCSVPSEDADRESIFRAAVRELQRTAFPDRGANCWKLIGFERY